MTNEVKDLIEVPQGTIVSTDLVNQIALRLQLTYQPPKRRSNQSDAEYQANVVQPEDFPVIVEIAMAQGHNPLSKTFHYWKQDGKLAVDDHYGPLMNWAQAKTPFTYTTAILPDDEKLKLEGINPGDWVVRFKAIRRADQQARQQYFKTILETAIAGGLEFEKALDIADRRADDRFAVQADGVVKYEELHYKSGNNWVFNIYATPKGWIPGVTRAEVRAIRNGIKKLVGIPMPEERKRLGLDMSVADIQQLAANVPEDIVKQGVAEEYMRLEAKTQEIIEAHKAEVVGLSPEEVKAKREERVTLLRGEKENGIGLEPVVEVVTVSEGEAVDEEPFSELLIAEDLGELEEIFDDLEPIPAQAAEMDAEYKSRQISLEDAHQILLRVYKNDLSINKSVKALLGLDTLGEAYAFSPDWIWNLVQYALRREILLDTNIPIDQRLAAIPEIDPVRVDSPKTVKAAGEFLHETLKLMCANNTKLRRLDSNA